MNMEHIQDAETFGEVLAMLEDADVAAFGAEALDELIERLEALAEDLEAFRQGIDD